MQQWVGNDFGPGGTWQTVVTCSSDEACVELTVQSDNYPDHAYCATSNAPDPSCHGMTGRFCSDDHHLFTCVNGFRVLPGDANVYDETCPNDSPLCYEPRPGLAFCVADTTPNPVCAGHPSRDMEFCATSYAACQQETFSQFCTNATTSVTCLEGVPIATEDCSGHGHCIQVDSTEVSACAP